MKEQDVADLIIAASYERVRKLYAGNKMRKNGKLVETYDKQKED